MAVSGDSGVRRAGRVLRHATVLAVGGTRSLGGDAASAARRTLALLPGPVRRPVARALATGRAGTVLQVVALADAGRRPEAAELLSRRAREDALAARSRRRLAATALAVGDAGSAAALVADLPPDDPGRRRLSAQLAASAGDLEAAVAAVSGPLPPGLHGVRARRTLRSLRGDLAVLTPERRPGVARRPAVAAEPGRVLHLVTTSLPHRGTGYAVRTQEVARHQQALGLDVVVATRFGFPVQDGVLDAAPVDRVDGVPYVRLLPRGLPPRTKEAALRAGVAAAARLVRAQRPAVLHAASDHLNGQVALAVRDRTGLPVVYEVRGFLEETWASRSGDDRVGADRHRLSRAAETWVMSRADAVVTLSEGMQAEVVSRGVPADRVFVVPNGVDERFLAPLPDPAPVRSRLGAAPGDVVVGAVTSVSGYEGLDVLARAVRLLRDRRVPVRLLVVGDGDALPGLRELVAELGLSEVAQLPGRVPFADVRAYLAALDVVAVPRRDVRVARLVTPLKPLEALASARPVVASDLPALAEVVGPDRGVLVRPEDPSALADALHRLVDDPRERDRLGAAGRAWVAEERRWAHLVPRYLDVYARAGARLPPVRPARSRTAAR